MVILFAVNILMITVSIVALFLISMMLVILLLYAKKKLVPEGKVTISINNGEQKLEVDKGSSLLATLGDNHIFLPSACGGSGTCAQCRCQVTEGGGAILPTEVGFFTRKEIQQNWRLGCQVKVKNDMEMKIPKSILGVKKWECEVISNKNVATYIKEFLVRLPEGEHLNFIPGGYIQIDIPKYSLNYSEFSVEKKFHAEWDQYKMWDLSCNNLEPTVRAYSMANYPAEGNIVMLNVRIATPPFDPATKGFKKVSPGIASSYLFNLKPGDRVMVSGPYGEFHPILDSNREMLYIGGGAGMAPLRSHILHLLKTLKITDRKISYWYGARSKEEIFYEKDFRALEKEFPNFTFNIALSAPLPKDHWTGYTGFIHDVIYKNYLVNHDEPEEIEYYMCGPGPMANAVKTMLDSLGVPPEMLMFDDFGS